VNPQAVTRPSAGLRSRQPLLWAALAFAGGVAVGVHMWRPPLWWLIAELVFAIAGMYFLRRRVYLARALGLCALFVSGALTVQVRVKNDSGNATLTQFTDGDDVIVTAHVTREGNRRGTGFDEGRQVLDVETEQISSGDQTVDLAAGLRINLYSKEARDEGSAVPASPARLFRYGERLRFPVKLSAPRNFRNPGTFDYVAYLKEKNIAGLGSTKTDSVEVLPGLVGTRMEFWRTRIHRSILEKVHALWRPVQAGLVDAMVLGEDAFITRDARVEFQRSGTYHVLVVSGMNVGILALVIFWALRRLRMGDAVASIATVVFAVGYAFLTDVGPPYLAGDVDAGNFSGDAAAVSRPLHAECHRGCGAGTAGG
jgi:competence protein ComEC